MYLDLFTVLLVIMVYVFGIFYLFQSFILLNLNREPLILGRRTCIYRVAIKICALFRLWSKYHDETWYVYKDDIIWGGGDKMLKFASSGNKFNVTNRKNKSRNVEIYDDMNI